MSNLPKLASNTCFIKSFSPPIFQTQHINTKVEKLEKKLGFWLRKKERGRRRTKLGWRIIKNTQSLLGKGFDFHFLYLGLDGF